MKTPVPPPSTGNPENLGELIGRAVEAGLAPWFAANQGMEYKPWDSFRFSDPPEGWTIERWWHLVRVSRRASERTIPGLVDKSGRPFTYNLPDEVLAASDEIARGASGQIQISELVTDPETRDRYIVNSLIEEAITSSQLEGASTTRKVAKEMLRAGRKPSNHGERMILNNYLAMERIAAIAQEPLTPSVVRELHRMVTDGTLENPDYAGRLQDVQEDRVSVWGDGNQLLHRPPAVDELPARLERLCAFANGEDDSPYMPPVLRAITIHFMMGYDHYFEDGNGRTARALFYWSMLREGYWLAEYLSISRLLLRAPAKYARSFLLTEQDDGDLTHFFIFHLEIIQRAIDELHEYLRVKARESRELQGRIRALNVELNHRQLAVVDHATKDPSAVFTARSHGSSHRVTIETARHDLADLERRGMLVKYKIGKQFAWHPAQDLEKRL